MDYAKAQTRYPCRVYCMDDKLYKEAIKMYNFKYIFNIIILKPYYNIIKTSIRIIIFVDTIYGRINDYRIMNWHYLFIVSYTCWNNRKEKEKRRKKFSIGFKKKIY